MSARRPKRHVINRFWPEQRPTKWQRLRAMSEDQMEEARLWIAARITVCLGCARYVVTNRGAFCRRCTNTALAIAAERAAQDDDLSYYDTPKEPA